MATDYIRGFYKWTVTVTTPKFGTFTTPVWARTAADAIAAANRKWRVTNARVTE